MTLLGMLPKILNGVEGPWEGMVSTRSVSDFDMLTKFVRIVKEYENATNLAYFASEMLRVIVFAKLRKAAKFRRGDFAVTAYKMEVGGLGLQVTFNIGHVFERALEKVFGRCFDLRLGCRLQIWYPCQASRIKETIE